MTVPILEGLAPSSLTHLTQNIEHESRFKMGLSFLTGGAALAALGGKFGHNVHDGEVLINRHLGNYDSPIFRSYFTFPPYVTTHTADGDNFRYGIKRRGFVVSVPGWNKWVPLSTRFNPDSPLDPEIVESEEGRQLRIGGSVTWAVIDKNDTIFKALRAVNNNRGTQIIEQLHPLVIDTVGRQLVATMEGKPIKEMKDLPERESELRTRCSGPLYDIGTCLGAVILKNPYYIDADRTANAQIESARETASAIRELAGVIRGASESEETDAATRPAQKDARWLQEAGIAAIGGVLGHADQQYQQPTGTG